MVRPASIADTNYSLVSNILYAHYKYGVWGLGFGVWGLGFGVWDVAVGRGGTFRIASSSRHQRASPQSRIWHRATCAGSMAGLSGHGKLGDGVQRAAQTGDALGSGCAAAQTEDDYDMTPRCWALRELLRFGCGFGVVAISQTKKWQHAAF